MTTLKTLTVGNVINAFKGGPAGEAMDDFIKELELRMIDKQDLFLKSIYGVTNDRYEMPIFIIIKEMTSDLTYCKERGMYRVTKELYRWIRTNQNPHFHYIDGIILLNEFLFGSAFYCTEYRSGCFYPYLYKVESDGECKYKISKVKYSKAFDKYFQ